MTAKCDRCGRFVGEEALEGWSGGLFGEYNGRLYCAFGVGCNSVAASERQVADEQTAADMELIYGPGGPA